MKKKKKMLPVYLLESKHEEFKKLAESKGETMTAIINNLIDKELRRSK